MSMEAPCKEIEQSGGPAVRLPWPCPMPSTPHSTAARPFPPELHRALPFTLLSLGKVTFPQRVKFKNRFSAEEMLSIPCCGSF